MIRYPRFLLTGSLLILMLNSCIPAARGTDPSPQERWLMGWLTDYKPKSARLWCLISRGGFAGGGKGSWLVASGDISGKNIDEVYYFAPGKTFPPKDKSAPLESKQAPRSIKEKFLDSAADFPDKGYVSLHPVLDGYSYEFFYLEKSDGKINIRTHFEMDDPYHNDKQNTGYEAMIQAFTSLSSGKP